MSPSALARGCWPAGQAPHAARGAGTGPVQHTPDPPDMLRQTPTYKFVTARRVLYRYIAAAKRRRGPGRLLQLAGWCHDHDQPGSASVYMQ